MVSSDFVKASADLANRQHGVIARRQLVEAGFSRRSIDWRIASGYITPLFLGTYAVGRSEIPQAGLWMAGVLASGDGAALAGGSAAAAHGFLRPRPCVETVRPGRTGRQRASVRTAGRQVSIPLLARRTRSLPESDLTVALGIPATTVARTLLDLCSLLPARQFELAFLEADRLGILDDGELAACASRDIRRAGVREFRERVAERIEQVGRTRSALEALFLRLCRDAGIELPEVNVEIDGREVDCVWRRSRLMVELDGYRYHRGRESFERDAARSNAFRCAGWIQLRFTWRMVTRQPEAVVAQLSDALRAGSSSAANRGAVFSRRGGEADAIDPPIR